MEVSAYGFLQVLVYVLRAADKAHRGHSEATAVHHALSTLYQARIVGQSQIVIGTKVEYFFTLYLDSGALWALNDTLLLVKACFFQVRKSCGKLLFNLSVHVIHVLVYTDNCKLTNYFRQREAFRVIFYKSHCKIFFSDDLWCGVEKN